MTNRTIEPNKAPVDGSSKNGDLGFAVGVHLYEFSRGLSSALQDNFQYQFAAKITEGQQDETAECPT